MQPAASHIHHLLCWQASADSAAGTAGRVEGGSAGSGLGGSGLTWTLFGWLALGRLVVLGPLLTAFPIKFHSLGEWVMSQVVTSALLAAEYALLYSRELPQVCHPAIQHAAVWCGARGISRPSSPLLPTA